MAEDVVVKELELLRIIPAFTGKGGPTLTTGTRVVHQSGELLHDLPGVFKIELEADVNDVWRAKIHCHITPPEVTAEGEVVLHPVKPLAECTAMDDKVTRARKPTRIVQCVLLNPANLIYEKPAGMFRAFDQARFDLVEIPYTSLDGGKFSLDHCPVGTVYAEAWQP